MAESGIEQPENEPARRVIRLLLRGSDRISTGGGKGFFCAARIAKAFCDQPDIPVARPEGIKGGVDRAFRRDKAERLLGRGVVALGECDFDIVGGKPGRVPRVGAQQFIELRPK